MADAPEQKSSFWSSLPGILTGLGGILVAVTGLITALYSAGIIGKKVDGPDPVSSVNAAVVQPAALAATPNAVSDAERYKTLVGKWEVVEEPSQDFSNVKSVTWQYDATVSANELTLSGKISAIEKDKNLNSRERRISARYVTTLSGLSGKGLYRLKGSDGATWINDATIRLNDGLTEFDGEVDVEGKIYRLKGRKM